MEVCGVAKLLKKVSNAYWVYYVNEAEAKKFDDSKVGKWMYFFKDNDFAAKICEKAVADGVVAEASIATLQTVCAVSIFISMIKKLINAVSHISLKTVLSEKLRLESYTISRLSSMIRHETANMATVLYLRSNSLIL